MDPQKRIDKILEAVQSRVQDEVCSLLGVDFSLADIKKQLVSKTDAFDNLVGKQICAKIDITGEVEGLGGLFLGIKDAIRLGGTLIMLPSSELEEMIGREEYTEEIEDSYGEIANIISGSFTKDFEEMYTKTCRFVRKEQEKIVPVKVEIDSDEPVRNELFYQVSYSMTLAGTALGEMVMLLPADPFNLSGDDGITSVAEETVSTDDGLETPSAAVATSKFNVEKHKVRVDRLLAACQEKLSGEIGALLGLDVDLSGLKTLLVSKEDFFFDHVSGKQVLADMDVVGDLENRSFFSVSIKDAVYLGGLLVMLPPSELEKTVNEEDFGEDAEDAYGEIANIIAGVYTAVFEEQYTKKLRFIRKSLQQVVPMKVDPESEKPVPDILFYLSSMSLNIDGKAMGDVHMLFPADMLQLDTFGQPDTEETVAENAGVQERDTQVASAADNEITPAFNVEKHKQRVDKLLGLSQGKLAEEVGALLGVEVKLNNLNNRIVNKEDFFFDEVSGRQVLADMDVVGDVEDKSYLSVSLKDAIRIGGALIMLPESELQIFVDDEDFNADMEDAYGEIANIISGVYTAVFEEGYNKQLRFIKTGLQQVVPMKVDPSGDEPIPEQNYYVSSMDLVLGDKELGVINALFPAQMLQLDKLGEEVEEASDVTGSQQPAATVKGKQDDGFSDGTVVAADDMSEPADILLIGDDEVEIVKLKNVLGSRGYRVRVLSCKDELHNYISGDLKAVYLVMRDIDEQVFGMAIKVSSACSLPVIAAAPDWTRSKVIKAVKYGIRDILLTPAAAEDIEENVANNLVKLAA